MTYEELLEILAEQFSCDEDELVDDLELADLGADHEDLIELAWNIGEAMGQEVSEKDLARCATVGDLWRFVRDLED